MGEPWFWVSLETREDPQLVLQLQSYTVRNSPPPCTHPATTPSALLSTCLCGSLLWDRGTRPYCRHRCPEAACPDVPAHTPVLLRKIHTWNHRDKMHNHFSGSHLLCPLRLHLKSHFLMWKCQLNASTLRLLLCFPHVLTLKGEKCSSTFVTAVFPNLLAFSM